LPHELDWDLAAYLERPYKHPRLVHTALGYAALGLRVIPLGKRSKRPWMERWPERASRDPDQVVRWFERSPESNIGIVTGGGVIGLDIDRRNGGTSSFKKLLDGRSLPFTAHARTGSGGDHYLFRVHPGIRIADRPGLMPGLDLKAEGGQLVAEPSIHPKTGREYVWLVSPAQVIAEAPDWLLRLVAERPPEAEPAAPLVLRRTGEEGPLIAQMIGRFPVTAQGQRNAVSSKVIASLTGRGFEADLVLRVVMGWFDHHHASGLIGTGRAEAERAARANIAATIKRGTIKPARSAVDHRARVAKLDLGGQGERLRGAGLIEGVLDTPTDPPHPCNRGQPGDAGPILLCQTDREFAFVEALLAYLAYKVVELGEDPPKATREQLAWAIEDRHGLNLSKREIARMKDKFIGRQDKPATRYELAFQTRTGRQGVPSEFRLTGLLHFMGALDRTPILASA
jgi:hypothetical protein